MRRQIVIATAISAAVHAAFIATLMLLAYREPVGTLGGGGTGGIVIVALVGGDEGGTGGTIAGGAPATDSKGEAKKGRVASKRSKKRHTVSEGAGERKKKRQQLPSREPMIAPPEQRPPHSVAKEGERGVGGPIKEGGDGTGGVGGDGRGWGSAGSGGGAGGGHGGGIGPGRGRGDPRLSRIWAKINRSKRYPWKARHHGWEGKPRVRFKINKHGQIDSVKLVSSCGIPELDQAAIETVKRSAPLPHYPKPITITIRYSLSE